MSFAKSVVRYSLTLKLTGSKFHPNANSLSSLYLRKFNVSHFPKSEFASSSRIFAADRRYSEKHEWVSKHGNVGTVGISNYAQEALGDVVYVQLPDIDSEYKKNDEVGAVESVKAASEIYTPISGKVIEINSSLEDKPNLVNTSCYEEGWLFKLELSNDTEYDSLMSEELYREYLEKVKN